MIVTGAGEMTVERMVVVGSMVGRITKGEQENVKSNDDVAVEGGRHWYVAVQEDGAEFGMETVLVRKVAYLADLLLCCSGVLNSVLHPSCFPSLFPSSQSSTR